jgi:hypothetical protein
LARNLWGFGAGLGFEMNANTNVEVSLLYQNRTYQEIPAPGGPVGSKAEDDGGTTYLLAARMFYQMQPNMLLVPVFKYYSYDLSQKSSVGPVTADNSLKGWQAGVAGNWTVGNNDLFVLGLAFASNKVDQEDGTILVDTDPTTGVIEPMISGTATETIAPELFSALETHVNNWLTFRFGARKGVYNKLKIEPTAGGSAETTSSPFLMSLGAGVKLGTLQLDAVMNDVFPQTLGGGSATIPTGSLPSRRCRRPTRSNPRATTNRGAPLRGRPGFRWVQKDRLPADARPLCVHPAQHDHLDDALDRDHERRHAHAHLVLLRLREHVVERAHHRVLQTPVDLILGPVEAHAILDPFE